MSVEKISALGARALPEPELTPAASEILDRNVEGIRRQILREIARVYLREPGYRARAADVESAVHNIAAFDAVSRPSGSRWATRLAIGLAAASLSVQLAVLATKSGQAWLIAAGALMVGTTTGVAAILVMQESRQRRLRSQRSANEFLQSFDTLESAVRDRARELLGDGAETGSLGRAISAVELIQLWTPEDSQAFRRIIAIRNSIVHEVNREPPVDEIAAGFSHMARLATLLRIKPAGTIRSKLSELNDVRAARVFAERVANTLRQAGLYTTPAQGDPGYGFLAGRSDSLKRVVIKFRRSGLLKADDVSEIAENAKPGMVTLVVTNVEISPYALDQIELSGKSHTQNSVSVFSWPDQSDPAPLVKAVTS
jgi:hypothetical protein